MAVTFSGKQQINCRRGADTQHDGAKDPSGRVLRNASTGDAAGETRGMENRDCLPFNGGHDDEDDKAQTRHRKEHDSERTPEFCGSPDPHSCRESHKIPVRLGPQ